MIWNWNNRNLLKVFDETDVIVSCWKRRRTINLELWNNFNFSSTKSSSYLFVTFNEIMWHFKKKRRKKLFEEMERMFPNLQFKKIQFLTSNISTTFDLTCDRFNYKKLLSSINLKLCSLNHILILQLRNIEVNRSGILLI